MKPKASKSIHRQTIRDFWQLCLQHRPQLYLILIIPVSSLLLNTFIPYMIGKILAALSRSPDQAMHYVPILAGICLAGVIANYIGFQTYVRLQAKIVAELEQKALDTLLQRGVGFHNNNIAGKLITDAGDYPTAFMQLTNAVMTTIVPFIASIIVSLGLIALNAPLLALLMLLTTICVIATAIIQTVRATPRRDQRHAARGKMVARMSDSITNSTNITIFATRTAELREFRALDQQLMKFRARDWSIDASNGTKRIAVLLAFELLFILEIIHEVSINPALLGIGIFTFSYALALGNRLFDIGTLFRTIEDNLLEASDMTRLVGQTPEVVDAVGALELTVPAGRVTFQDVAFAYSDARQTDRVFNGLTLDIPAGQKIGLVGPSGGGKSTLTRLLLRFEDIQSGSIAIDDQSIVDVAQDSLRRAIAYVPQEPLLFHRTIRENIAYGKSGATLKDVRNAARKAHALEFIEALPHSFDTIVGERGVKLSGGQRQRVAIARAILKDAPILVLDEATSALDSESEAAIQAALNELMKGRTTLVIAHRLSTIQRLDRIVVLQDGAIVEDGPHTKLLADKGLYAKLWGHQSGGFIED